MGGKEPTPPEGERDVQAAIAAVRMVGLLRHLDNSRNENIDETTVELDDGWDVRLSTGHASGEAVCFRLVVEPRGTAGRGWTASLFTPTGGITSSLLRKIPLASLLDVLDQVRAGERGTSTAVVDGKDGRVRGPMPLSDEWIRVVAAAYVHGFLTKPQAPLQGAVAALGEGYSYGTVREHVQRARDKGFLAPTKQGQSRLELGPRWREVISLLHEALPAEIRAEVSDAPMANVVEGMFQLVLDCSDEEAASQVLRNLVSAMHPR